MASELLKNRALIQKLKEPEVPTVKLALKNYSHYQNLSHKNF
jgi:hypothetical protein